MAEYDVFLSHAYVDKAMYAEPLKKALKDAGLTVWYDDAEIKLGDSIVAKVNEGIQKSRFGIVLFTPGFVSSSKGVRWAEFEAFLSEQMASGRTNLLSLIVGLSHQEFVNKLPLVKGRKYESIAISPRTQKPSATELRRVTQAVVDAVTIRTTAPLMSRDELSSRFGGLETRLAEAKQEIRISGNDCKAVVESKSAFMDRALARDVTVKIMCVDPDSEAAVETLTRIDPRFTTAAKFIASMRSVEIVLRELRDSNPSLFDFRYMPIAPSAGLFIVDPELPGALIKAEIYTPKPWSPAPTRPHIVITDPGFWREYFLSTWDNYWAMSRVVD